MQPVAPQIQKAIFQPHRFRRIIVFGNLKRQCVRLTEQFHIVRDDFNRAGREFGVDRFRRSGNDLARETHHGFDAPMFERAVKFPLRIDDDLREAVMIAQINKNNPAMIADAVNPA